MREPRTARRRRGLEGGRIRLKHGTRHTLFRFRDAAAFGGVPLSTTERAQYGTKTELEKRDLNEGAKKSPSWKRGDFLSVLLDEAPLSIEIYWL